MYISLNATKFLVALYLGSVLNALHIRLYETLFEIII